MQNVKENEAMREDILISICFPDYITNQENDRELEKIAYEINSHYRYWEIIILVDATITESYKHLVTLVDNVRLLEVRHNLQHYRKRTIAASEAIGDVVLLSSIREIPYLDISAMIENANKKDFIVVGVQNKKSIFNPFIKALGIASGFHVSINDLSTAAYPRTLINQLLSHSNRQLALRFTPRDNRIPLSKQVCTEKIYNLNSLQDWFRRLSFIYKLFTNSAPIILTFVAIMSSLVSVSAPFYGLYAVITWLTIDNVQPGWLTTSLVLSLTATFLGIALLGITMGVQNILDKLSVDVMDDVIGEISTVDLFGQVSSDLNVEVVANDPTDQSTKQSSLK